VDILFPKSIIPSLKRLHYILAVSHSKDEEK